MTFLDDTFSRKRRASVHSGCGGRGRRFALSLLFFALIGAEAGRAQERISYENLPVRTVLADVEERTGFHFLYRDALVAGVRLNLRADTSSVLPAVLNALQAIGLDLRVDSLRKQVLLTQKRSEVDRLPPFARGIVLDDETGSALPFATVTWFDGDRLRGTAADASGAFRIPLKREETREISVSHVGYRPRTIRVDGPASIAVRLQAADAYGPDLVVSASALQSDVDTSLHYLLQEGISAPFAEAGVLRSLQVLPAVSFAAAATPGLNVRGSRADGFAVVLDGMPIYRHHHFFGLFDAFNQEALQTVGLYYGIQPARLAGPPGGTVAFVTRSGSRRRVGGTAGLGSTSGHVTIEGPLYDGGGSWLLSARRSLIDAFDWFRNRELIGLGLNVGRETGPLPPSSFEVPDRAVRQGEAGARFYDLHGQLVREWPSGARLSMSAYAGGDHAAQDAVRFANDASTRDVAEQTVETITDTESGAASAQLQLPLHGTALLRSMAGMSRYQGSFRKDDFVYSDPTRALLPTDTTDHVVALFKNENRLLELKLSQELDVVIGSSADLSAGYSLQRFEVTYSEESVLHSRPGSTRSSVQLDLFAESELEPVERIDLQLGLRTHYFSAGNFLRLSPRLRARAPVLDALSVGAGYSRNHQFLHRLYLEQDSGADVWVPSTPGEPPTRVDHVTAGVYASPAPLLYVQVELYRKRFRNLREHVASAARRMLRLTSPVLDPWLHDNDALARGAEFLARMRIGPVLWSNAYTLSSTEITNPRVNRGRPYPADWDRRHQVTSHLLVEAGRGFQAHLTWMYATGAPNTLWREQNREPSRLGPYHRMDVGMRLRRPMLGFVAELDTGVFNLYDRDNPWYRAPVAVVGRSPQGRRVGLVNVDVYDLGFQPSFKLTLHY